ncbi:mechanosensitive ion channel family protein [Sphingopyxis sp. BSNA05]|uniref:mechanosensitive ion channel family protein n=1 Tax=Sphingopyxis sp. BSNA05 TaxID=1236614 RepID=UPI0015638F7C|nr:mechanosensitive ion channel family protein [Sphingopyxis sp. BSNA05]NRD89070.1 mechanosensitive ion channel family protein [Sphingopyxis sp. BSNA05]
MLKELNTITANIGSWEQALLSLALFVIIGLILSSLFNRIMRRIIRRQEQTDLTTLHFMKQFGRFAIWILVLMYYAHTVPALNSLGTALLASASIASVVIGMAAQSTLGNLIAGFSLLMYKPFRVGDRMQIVAPNSNGETNAEIATVESITLGYTILTTLDNRRIVIANSVISTQVLVNLSAIEEHVICIVPISIGYSEDIDIARSAILDVASQHELSEEVIRCSVTSLGASSIDFSLRIRCRDSQAARQLKFDMFELIKKRFDKLGIEIPYSYVNVLLPAIKNAE